MYARVEPDCQSAPYDNLADADLIRRAKLGDDRALGALLARHRDALYRFCLHLTSHPDDAEDICQETLARAITRVGSLQSNAAFRTWLFRIARNLCIDSFRAQKKTCALPEEITELPSLQDGPQECVEVDEERQTVAEALAKLADSHQKVLVLREVEGLSYADISQRMNVSQSAVETLLFRARRRLREEFSKSYARIPGMALFGLLRDAAIRVAGPAAGAAPLAAKVAVTAVVVGGAVATAPHVIPALPSTPHHTAVHQVTGLSRAPHRATHSVVRAPSAPTTSAVSPVLPTHLRLPALPLQPPAITVHRSKTAASSLARTTRRVHRAARHTTTKAHRAAPGGRRQPASAAPVSVPVTAPVPVTSKPVPAPVNQEAPQSYVSAQSSVAGSGKTGEAEPVTGSGRIGAGHGPVTSRGKAAPPAARAAAVPVRPAVSSGPAASSGSQKPQAAAPLGPASPPAAPGAPQQAGAAPPGASAPAPPTGKNPGITGALDSGVAAPSQPPPPSMAAAPPAPVHQDQSAPGHGQENTRGSSGNARGHNRP